MENFKEKNYFCMSYDEFNELVRKYYSVNYDFLGQNEASNGIDYTFNDIKSSLNEWEQEDVSELKEALESTLESEYLLANTRVILMDLCDKGFIPSGNYMIRVSW